MACRISTYGTPALFIGRASNQLEPDCRLRGAATVSEAREIRLAWAWILRSAGEEPAGTTVSGAHAAGFSALFEVVNGALEPVTNPASSSAEEFQLTRISSYAHLPPRDRPSAYCPNCRERVWLKLGGRMRHHYAHRAESDCVAAGGEGALHLSAKLHLASELRPHLPLQLEYSCGGAETDRQRCLRVTTVPFPLEWDELRVEEALPSLRADILLLRNGKPVAAIEVYSSHAVGDVRAEKYRNLGVPWLEVSASGIVERPAGAWTTEDPLPALVESRLHPERWRCPAHARLHAAWLDQQLNGEHRFASRLVHLYRNEAGITRAERRTRAITISMIEIREQGRVVAVRMEREDTGSQIGPTVRADDRLAGQRELHRHFRSWVRWLRKNQSAAIDSPMRWVTPEEMPEFAEATVHPERLRWDAHEGEFVGAPNRPGLAWPVVSRSDLTPHPVLGIVPCYWSALPTRARGAELNGIFDRCWVTLGHQEWVTETGPQTRADLAFHRHTGARWELVGREQTANLPLLKSEAEPWNVAFVDITRSLAAAQDAIVCGDVSISSVVESAVSEIRKSGRDC